ncbi:MAG TPA: hypothetical protein VII06_34640 [Chloroflexota bacterium]|jgi:hypothetical protein
MSDPPAEPGPAPTIWPATVAAGITLMGAGLVVDLSVWTESTRLGFFLGGLVLLALGLAGWVRALRDEGRASHE